MTVASAIRRTESATILWQRPQVLDLGLGEPQIAAQLGTLARQLAYETPCGRDTGEPAEDERHDHELPLCQLNLRHQQINMERAAIRRDQRRGGKEHQQADKNEEDARHVDLSSGRHSTTGGY